VVAKLTFPVSNALAQELGSDRDRILMTLAERLGCEFYLRGNELVVEGPDDMLGRARIVIEELGGLVEQGLAIGPQTVEALGGVLDAGATSADVLHDVVWRHRGKKIAPKTLNQKRYVDAIRRATITFGIGPAGTGKTYLAMALAVSALIDREVSRIILTRPAVEAGEHLGFLPGDLQAKVDPYLRPLFDAVYDMMDADRLQMSMEKGLIEVAPLAFMRGRTLNDSFIILDEAQNTTPEQMQMFLTRLGFNSKVVVTGDVTQTDLKNGQRSGLVDVDDLLRGIPDIEFVYFGSEDVVRHKLVARIVSAYKARSEANQESARS
jgi:phosphate starvation-inducible PhoH-like protein